MEKEIKHKTIKMQLQADKTVIPAGKPGARILEINLTAPGVTGDRPRIPLNLALVIDRSGSMHGEKLHFVKQAAAHVIDLMNQDDRAAIIIYDNEVSTLMSSQYLTDQVKRAAKAKIAQIQTGGSTYLYGGWLTGCRQAAEAIRDETFNRTLLLTDGLANVGTRDVGTIATHAQELFSRHISTSCFGVGSDYDEHMLESIANNGGGNFHFLETVNAIPLVFEREFDEIIRVALKDIRVVLTLPDNVEAKVSASWHTERAGAQLTVFLGSLVAEQTQSLYLQLANLEADGDRQLEIPIKVIGVDLDQVEHQTEALLTFSPAPAEAEAAMAQDASLMERFALVDLADRANEALKMERAGDRLGSARMMQNSISAYEANIPEDTLEKYQMMSKEMSVGYDELERKRRHFQEYQTKRGWQSIRDYPLNFKTGVPLASIESKVTFINTAAAQSIAVDPEWLFQNQVYKFQQSFNGMTCEQLSKALGTRVDVMLGMDVLRDLHVRINPAQGLIQFSRQAFRSSGARLPMKIDKAAPIVTLNIGKKEVRMQLVTALKFNYLPAEFVDGLNEVSQVSDRLPLGLEFTTPLFKHSIPLGQRMLGLNFGLVPQALRGILALGADEGVLGADLLQSVPVTLAFPDREMILFV